MKQAQAQLSTNASNQKLFSREVIWIQFCQWPNTETTCGKYPYACVMPERYFVFKCCSAKASMSESTRKRKQGRFHGEMRIMIQHAFLLASLLKTWLSANQRALYDYVNMFSLNIIIRRTLMFISQPSAIASQVKTELFRNRKTK